MAKRKWVRTVLFIAGGMAIGWAYSYFIGCRTGSCPITSNPWNMAPYCGVIGWLVSIITKRENKEQ